MWTCEQVNLLILEATMSSRYSAGLTKIKAEGQPAHPDPAETPVAATRVTVAASVAPSRQGKKAIAAYFDPAVRKQLAMLAVQEEQTRPTC